VYKRARYYDANTGEFLSRDPLEYVDGMSMYRGYFLPTKMDPHGKLSVLRDVTSEFVEVVANQCKICAKSAFDAEVDSTKGVSDAEKKWCKENPCCCYDASNSKDAIVLAMKTHYGTPSGNGSVYNAVQHCAWMCEVANNLMCSASQAIALGEAHEKGNSNGPLNDGMDLYNNGCGAKISSYTTNGCIQKCEEKAKRYELYWYEPKFTPAYPNNPKSPRPLPSTLPSDFPGFPVDPMGNPGETVGTSSEEPVLYQ
jgi:hypothetical protein